MDDNNLQDNNKQDKGNRQKPKRPNLSWFYLAVMVALFFFFMAGNNRMTVQDKDLSYTKLQAYVENNVIEKITIYDDNHVVATVRPEASKIVFPDMSTQTESDNNENQERTITTQIPSVTEFSEYMTAQNQLRKDRGETVIELTFEKAHDYLSLILWQILPLVLFILFFGWMSRGMRTGGMGGIFGVGKVKAEVQIGRAHV